MKKDKLINKFKRLKLKWNKSVKVCKYRDECFSVCESEKDKCVDYKI